MDANEYLSWRHLLGAEWRRDGSFMALLKPQQQWDLHAYFEFHKEKSDEEALSWLWALSVNEPDRVGRALDALDGLTAHFERLLELENQQKLPLKSAGRHPIISSIVQPEPDMNKLARALLMLAEDMTEPRTKKDY